MATVDNSHRHHQQHRQSVGTSEYKINQVQGHQYSFHPPEEFVSPDKVWCFCCSFVWNYSSTISFIIRNSTFKYQEYFTSVQPSTLPAPPWLEDLPNSFSPKQRSTITGNSLSKMGPNFPRRTRTGTTAWLSPNLTCRLRGMRPDVGLSHLQTHQLIDFNWGGEIAT